MNLNLNAINSQLSTNESKKTNSANKQNRNRIIDVELFWRVITWQGEGRTKGKVQGLGSTNW